ncbi:protein deacetylase HDAC6-like, partial [Cetorhinus maximus]
MEQEATRSKARLGSLSPRMPSSLTSAKNAKGKVAVGKSEVKKHVRIKQEAKEDEIVTQLHHLKLDRDRLRTGTGLAYDPVMAGPRCLWDSETPESPDRVTAVMDKLQEYGLLERCQLIPPRLATKPELLLVHSPDFIDLIKSTEKMGNMALKAHSEAYDLVYFHPETYAASCTAVGCVLNMVDCMMKGDIRNGLAVV